MLVDDPLENDRIASSVPRAFGIHDRDRTTFADAKAIRFRTENAAGFGQAQLLEPLFQKFPCFDRSVTVAAFRIGLVGAQEDVPPGVRYTDGCGEILQACSFG